MSLYCLLTVAAIRSRVARLTSQMAAMRTSFCCRKPRMSPLPCRPTPMAAITILSLGAILPSPPRAEEGKIGGKPATPPPATHFRKSRRPFIQILLISAVHKLPVSFRAPHDDLVAGSDIAVPPHAPRTSENYDASYNPLGVSFATRRTFRGT